jgi:hypothetical protein
VRQPHDFFFQRLVVRAGDIEGGHQPAILLPQLLALILGSFKKLL